MYGEERFIKYALRRERDISGCKERAGPCVRVRRRWKSSCSLNPPPTTTAPTREKEKEVTFFVSFKKRRTLAPPLHDAQHAVRPILPLFGKDSVNVLCLRPPPALPIDHLRDPRDTILPPRVLVKPRARDEERVGDQGQVLAERFLCRLVLGGAPAKDGIPVLRHQMESPPRQLAQQRPRILLRGQGGGQVGEVGQRGPEQSASGLGALELEGQVGEGGAELQGDGVAAPPARGADIPAAVGQQGGAFDDQGHGTDAQRCEGDLALCAQRQIV